MIIGDEKLQTMKFTRVLFLLVLVNVVSCENILIIDDIPSPSHQIWHGSIADALVSRGYNVTVLRPGTLPVQKQKNLHTIIIEEVHNDHTEWLENLDELTLKGPLETFQLYFATNDIWCDHLLKTRGVQELLSYPKDFKFDAILMDLNAGPCFFPMIQIFNYPPAIGTTPFLLPPFLSELFGNSIQPSYLPFFSLDLSENMTFWERLQNYFWTVLNNYMFNTSAMYKLEPVIRSNFGDDIRPLVELRKHISLLLCNLLPGLHYSQPLTPNIIPVGGLHIKPTKALPEDLQKIMDNAKNGVILFSLGTNVRSAQISSYKKNCIIEVFRSLNETILWKFESELKGLPKNVIIRKWLPQNELLAHPNMKLFITHGGGLSTIEATHFGVPILGIPFYVDQRNNIHMMVDRGLGLKLEYSSITKDSFLKSISEMLLNPKYSRNAKELSRKVRDSIQTPMDRAIFWIEYSIRHNGTYLLDPKSRELPRLTSTSADIHLFLLLVMGLVLIVLKKVINFFIALSYKLFKAKRE